MLGHEQSCRPAVLRDALALSFLQRFCLTESNLITPSFAAKAALFGAFGELRNEPYLARQNGDDYMRRFGVYYARRAAQNTGELLGGYLNHEDSRPHASMQDGFWKRTKAALLSVTFTENDEGEKRLALAPIAGALGSGMVGVACYRTHNSLADGFRRTGLSYGSYFGTALFREFKPDIAVWASHLRRKKRADWN